MDNLAQLLGEEAANTIVAWAKTGGVPFFDGPDNLHAADETLAFVQALREKKILRIGRPDPDLPMGDAHWAWWIAGIIAVALLVMWRMLESIERNSN